MFMVFWDSLFPINIMFLRFIHVVCRCSSFIFLCCILFLVGLNANYVSGLFLMLDIFVVSSFYFYFILFFNSFIVVC